MVNRSINSRVEVRRRIREAALDGHEILDLTDIELEYLPNQICELDHLKELYLNPVGLKVIPSGLSKLTNLEVLSFTTYSDENYDSISHDYDHYTKYKSPAFLEFTGECTKKVPLELWNMKKLRVLRLGLVDLDRLPFEIGNLTNLEVLQLKADIRSFPKSIKNLTKLKILISVVMIDCIIPTEIEKLSELKLLSLSVHNKLGYVDSNYNNIKPTKKKFKLISKKNTVIDTNVKFKYYDNETNIYFRNFGPVINNVDHLNFNFINNLSDLRLIGLQLGNIPRSVYQCKNLKKLNLERNYISLLEKEISQMIQLNEINLSYNKIETGLNYLGKLPNLRKLNLGYNRIKEINELDNLNKLIYLDVTRNNISRISEKLFKYFDYDPTGVWNDEMIFRNDRKAKFEYGDNPLINPPLEIIAEGRQALIDYFESLKGKTMPLNEVKVLLVGDGGAGKTSLVKRILGEKFSTKEEQTQGININNWSIECDSENMNVRLWDFGGQEIMHSTHQFFLSKRSLYVLVLDGRKEEKTEYWLKHIESFGGGSPVLVVLNKMDENPSFDVNRSFLLEKYTGIKGFYKTSCSSGEGVSSLLDALKEELTNAELRQSKWAMSWFDVKEKLDEMKEPFIDLETYSEICSGNGVEDTAQDTLVGFLHDLGIAMHFKDLNLQGVHVLEPRWVTQAVYKIINSEVLAKTKGILQFDKLDEILKKKDEDDYIYSPDKYSYIVNLMKKFELCYSLDESSVLIPDLLEVEQTNFKHDSDDLLSFYFEYEFLPRSIMPRFMVQLHKDIRDEHRWRTGVVLEDNTFDSVATIVADIEKRRISISVEGAQKRDYFAIIRKTFNDIHKGFKKLKVNEWVPLPGFPEFAVTYRNLVGHEAAGRETYYDGELLAEFSVSRLLDGIEKPGKRTNIINEEQSNKHSLGLTTIEVFLASSSELEEERNKVEIWVRRQNNELIQNGYRLKLHLWEDFLDAMSKTRLQDEYNKAVLRSDIMLCLFATKIGRFTKEEFEVAYNGFKESGRPRFIYTYFKEAQIKVTDETAISNSNELNKFRKSLVELGHFPSFFKSIDDLENQLSNQVVKILKEYSTES